MPYVLILIGCIGLLFSSISLNINEIQQLDLSSVEWMSLHRSGMMNGLAITLSYLGGLPPMIVVVIIGSLYFLRLKQYANIFMLTIGLLGATTIGWIVKYAINRPRPDDVYQMVQTYGASFPSAHSIYAALLSCSIVFIFRKHRRAKLICLVCGFWFLSMGISRVYLGAHFPTDVLAGWSIGFIWAAIIWLMLSSNTLSKNKLFLNKNLNEVE
ncbi:phosphatase PAP2 family protein [Acinetobacter rongchengensis]|uniref:undecaprenyl-diphosphate phosphatase n=1 Tax=Acinetobacter rongchengensis TaxID=2419601 RepID=A0A3A8EY10_9GAMM|nr:phosphatase PAP2 family protein [Acinetobacter rongchengensis]RKG39058.1 phosphatase PAP2 family protein [Acinetobacter rongchengensis]